MPGNETDLANYALSLIGSDTIGSILDPDDPKAAKIRRIYPNNRDFCLRLRDWNCATDYQSLAGREVSAFAPNEFRKAYQLPTDPFCLKARRLTGANVSPYCDTFEPRIFPFRIVGRVIVCNELTPTLVYTKRLDDPMEFDSALWECVSEYLAANLALALGPRDVNMKIKMLQAFAIKYDLAAAVDQVEGGGDSATPSELVTIRR